MFTIGTFINGTSWNMKAVSGKITEIYPGLGFLLTKDLYTYLAIDNFKEGDISINHHIQGIPSEFMNIRLSKETVLFWLNSVPAKSTIYGKEIREKKLIDPMTDGLRLGFKVAPLIPVKKIDFSWIPDDIMNFYLQFGIFPCDIDPGNTPVPMTTMTIREDKRQMDMWHYARAKLDSLEGNYTYHFLDCGRLRVEMGGQKISLIGKMIPEVEVPKVEVPEVPEDEVPEISEWNLKNLSMAALIQGIEESHWNMRRIRKNPASTEYLRSMSWVDAAWDEIQARREEESAEIEDPYEKHY